MPAINFPSSPANNQIYSVNGVQYYYNGVIGAWLTNLITNPINANTTNTQIFFNDGGYANGNPSLRFDKFANTFYTSNISVAQNVSASYFIGDGSKLVGVGVTVSNTAPSPAYANTMWWNTKYGRLFIYYNDGDSAQWVDASPSFNPASVFDVANSAYSRANNSVYEGYFNSTLYGVVTGDPAGDLMGMDTFVGQTVSTDAFGVALVDVFDLMDPVGSLQTVDLGSGVAI